MTEIGAATHRAPELVASHLVGPAPIIRVVEIVAGLLISADTMESDGHLGRDQGKQTDHLPYHPAGRPCADTVDLRASNAGAALLAGEHVPC